jgi:hypothetical protein
MDNSYIIPPVDWCLIQYLFGFTINTNYESLEDSFKVLLKQYILYFNVTNISSRDKKNFLQNFIEKYNKFQEQTENIKNILKEYIQNPCHDDLIYTILQVSTFNIINKYDFNSNQFINYVKISNINLINFFMGVLKNIMNHPL